MGSDPHPRTLRLSPLSSKRIGDLHRSRFFRQVLIFIFFQAGSRENSIFRYLGQPSVLYAPFGASLETGASVFPERNGIPHRPLSCRHHPAAFRVIPSFREGVYLPAAEAALWFAFLRHGTASSAFWHSGAGSRRLRRALTPGIPAAFPRCGRSGSFHCRKPSSLGTVFIPLMHRVAEWSGGTRCLV